MKKITVFFSVVTISTVSLISCSKKSYTCTCTISGQVNPNVGGHFSDMKKSDAEAECQSIEDIQNSPGTLGGAKCVLTQD